MNQKNFWSGFATGAAVALAGFWASSFVGRGGESRIVRLEKSLQIGRPVRDVFDAWSDIRRIPSVTDLIESVDVSGNRSRWVANVGGSRVQWEAELVQVIPEQMISWKTVGRMQHTGRVVFSPVGDDTLVHVQMNYAPPSRAMRPFFSVAAGQMEGYIEHVLRDFKAALERQSAATAATGTYGPESAADKENPRFGPAKTPVEYTRPTKPDDLKSSRE